MDKQRRKEFARTAAEELPQSFPILEAHARNPNTYRWALNEVALGLKAGEIRNVVLNDAKSHLSNVVDAAWKAHVSEPHFYGGKWESQTRAVRDLYNGLNVMGLHSIIATSKKVSKSREAGVAMDAMRAFVHEVLPLAEAVAFLKDKVVKGRAPNTNESKSVNPNKLVKTCPCCFRKIAVVRSTMAHHGYERPGHGVQTASCPGIRFQPLEVSNEGLVWIIGVVRKQLEDEQAAYDTRQNRTELLVPGRRFGDVMVRITKGSPDWERAFERFVMHRENNIRMLTRDLKHLEGILAAWKPEVPLVPAAKREESVLEL